MRAICAGTKTKHDVVHETLEKYQEMYMRTVARLDVLKLASRLQLCSAVKIINDIYSLSANTSLVSKTFNHDNNDSNEDMRSTQIIDMTRPNLNHAARNAIAQ